MELTKEHEEYRLARPGAVAQVHRPKSDSAAALHLQRTRSKAEEDAMGCQLYVPQRTSLFVGCNSGTLLVWKPKNEFQSVGNRSKWRPFAAAISVVRC